MKNILGGAVGSDTQSLTGVGGMLFFTADLPWSGREMWKSDGTAAGTVIVENFSGSVGSNPRWPTDVNGTLFFTADLPWSGREM